MKRFAFLPATVVLTTATVLMAGGGHHHHGGHFGFHYHPGHGYHYGFHRSHYGSGFSGLGLYFGRPSYYYRSYSYPLSYGYSYPYSYSYPSYRSYGYSYPSCAVSSVSRGCCLQPSQTPAQPPEEGEIEPAPEAVPPPNPSTGPAEGVRSGSSKVASLRHAHESSFTSGEQSAVGAQANAGIPNLGLQSSVPKFHSLLSDESVPFVVEIADAAVAVQESERSTPPPSLGKTDRQTVRLTIPEGMEGIKLLPISDQSAALAQRTCPVTGDRLGADGMPLKVSVRGETVFVCCQGCVEDLQRNPERYLAHN